MMSRPEIAIHKKAIEIKATYTYTVQRPNYSNYMLTPNQMHLQKQIKMSTYKTKNSTKLLLSSV